MIAVKEALNTPDAVFLPMVIVDTIVPYTWMGILVALAARQKSFDTWNRSDRRILDDLAKRTGQFSKQKKQTVQSRQGDLDHRSGFACWAFVPGCSLFIYRRARMCSRLTPGPLSWFPPSPLFLSLTPLSRIPHTGANKFGKWILYFVLTSIGARASLNNASQVGILIVAGVVVILIHVTVLL